MRELQYPFDGNYIVCNKKRIKRELLETKKDWVKKRIAILGGSTTSDIKQILDIFLLNEGIQADFYESEYNQYYQEAVFDNPKLLAFNPDIIYICTSNRNIEQYPNIDDDEQTVKDMLKCEYERYKSIWDSLFQKYNCCIIQNNFEMPYFRILGNRDSYDIHGRVNYLSKLNEKFYLYAREHDSFHICDINYISSDYGLREWGDPFYYYMYKYALSVNAIPYLSYNISNIVKSIYGKNKKGLILDLDNTIWGGEIGENGVDGIRIGPEDPEGLAYLEFQKYINELSSLGVILCVNSKNDRENAVAGLEHPDCILKEDDFVNIKANWRSKDQNHLDIANEIGVLPDSLVFIDDNPAERDLVSQQIRGVKAPEIGEVYQYISVIDRSGFFENTSMSSDDRKRKKMYDENLKRVQAQALFSDYNDYLKSLEMCAIIRSFEPIYYSRIAQLTNKSNQFNLTTKRFSISEIEKIANSNTYITLYGKLYDRFGDNGIVSIVIGKVEGESCHIELWVMSCRVLKRDMEYAMMNEFVNVCSSHGIKEIIGYYYPTAKNKMVKEFYSDQGFVKIQEDDEGNTKWRLSIEDHVNKNTVIEIKV